jgi:serine/threonine-protein kinase RsbW
MIDRPEVRLRMPARAEGVGVVRQALVGMADALAFDAGVLADMRMAVTEACTNVVVHAYASEDGRAGDGLLEIDLWAEEAGLTVVVRDHGSGIQSPDDRAETPALGLGLPLIAALSDDFEVGGRDGGGTEVRMSFLSTRSGDPVEANPIGETSWEPPAEA